MFLHPFAHDLVVGRDRDFLIRGLAALPDQVCAECIQLEPDNATYLDTYAWVFFTQGNYVLAKIYIENAISKDTTESADLVDHYGDILYMNGNKEKALEQWKKAAELGKDTEVLREKIEKGEYIEDKNAAYNESF